MMLQNTSMNLKEIREMDYSDFDTHLRLIMYFKEAEHQAANPPKKKTAKDILEDSVKQRIKPKQESKQESVE